MLAKKYRLPIQKFSPKSKTVFRGRRIVAKMAQNDLPYDRMGVIVGKKFAKKTTTRNKIKREAFNLFKKTSLVEKKKNKKGHDILFIVNQGNVDKGDMELSNELGRAIEKIAK